MRRALWQIALKWYKFELLVKLFASSCNAARRHARLRYELS